MLGCVNKLAPKGVVCVGSTQEHAQPVVAGKLTPLRLMKHNIMRSNRDHASPCRPSRPTETLHPYVGVRDPAGIAMQLVVGAYGTVECCCCCCCCL
jgi:hypothetical protein